MVRSAGLMPSTGEIAPPSTWYSPRKVCVDSMVMTSRDSSTTQSVSVSRVGSEQ